MKRSINWENLYDQGRGNNFPEPLVVRFVKNFINTDSQSKLNAVDIGCGLGAHSILMAQLGIKVLSLDISNTAISNLNNKAIDEDISNINAVCANIEQFELEKNKYDLILDIAALQHADKNYLKIIFSRIKSGLKLKGRFYSWCLSSYNGVNDENHDYSIITKQSLKKNFNHGFVLTFDKYKYTQNNGENYIEFLIFCAERIE